MIWVAEERLHICHCTLAPSVLESHSSVVLQGKHTTRKGTRNAEENQREKPHRRRKPEVVLQILKQDTKEETEAKRREEPSRGDRMTEGEKADEFGGSSGSRG